MIVSFVNNFTVFSGILRYFSSINFFPDIFPAYIKPAFEFVSFLVKTQGKVYKMVT